MSDPPLLHAGAMVDHFKVMRLIGRGGMGEVYLARDTKLGRRTALKIVNARAQQSVEALEAFRREAQTTALFSHPNIVTLHAVGEYRGRPYVALEYLQGEDLATRIGARPPGLTESLRIALAIARALEEAHRHGVLHLDLKPSNVVIPADGQPRVVDFGLATTMQGTPSAVGLGSSSPPSTSGKLWGTPVYTAPERWRRKTCGGATDIWALGVILFELCSGRLPFPDATPVATRDAILDDTLAPDLRTLVDVPQPLADLVASCLAKPAEKRATASHVVATLERVLGNRRPQATAESPFRGLLPFDQRHAGVFFGRDAEVDAFVERLRHQPVLSVVGPTGAGKSSFVHAGVIPRLREQEPWVVLHMRPGPQPFVTLADRLRRRETQTFARSGEIVSNHESLVSASRASIRSGSFSNLAPEEIGDDTGKHAALLREARTTLALTLRRIADDEGAKVLLVIDQLEELVTMVESDEVRRSFMEAICLAADDPLDPVRVILTVRDDFLGRLSLGPAVRDALAQVTVVMTLEENALDEILRKPVEAMGYRYEDDELVSDMVGTVAGEPGCLPLLQFAGQMLWERRDEGRRLLLRSAYKRMGGVAGALAKHADGVLAELSPDELRVARQILLLLVSPERTRKVAALDEVKATVGEGADTVLTRLVHARLVSITRIRDAAGSAPRVELAHESLIHTWTMLARWVDETREELGLLADATAAADLWDKRGRHPEELWQGDALRDAERTLTRLTFALPPRVARFMESSSARERARARRRWSLLAGAFGLLTAVAAVAVFIAVLVADKEREAREERNEARAQREVAQEQREVAQAQRAVALRDGARAAAGQGKVLEARAKLRLALEHADSALARALWWTLSADPLLWRVNVGAFGLSVAYSPDGTTIATGCQDVALCLFDVETRAVSVLRGHREKVSSVSFSADGRTLASGDWAGSIVLWNVATGQVVRTLREHDGRVLAVAFDPTSDRLASAGRDRSVRLWATGGDGPSVLLTGHTGGIEGLAFSPDGGALATGSEDKTVRVWDLQSREVRHVLRHDAAVEDVAFAPDGSTLASGANDGDIALWDPATGARVGTLAGHTGGVRGLSYAPGGASLVSASYDGTVAVWDLESMKARRSFVAHPGSARDVAFSPDGQRVASTGYDGTTSLWSVQAEPRPVIEEGHASAARGADFNPEGTILASGGFDQNVRLWDVETGEPLAVLRGHEGAVYGVDFSPDGRWLAAASAAGNVHVWNAATLEPERVLRGHDASVYAVHFSPDSATLASASRDQTVRLWDVDNGKVRRVLTGNGHIIWDVRFGPSGRHVASASWDYTVRVWNAETGAVHQELTAHESAAYGVAFTPDGKHVVTSSADKTVRLFDLADGSDRVIATAARGNVLDVHPDGDRIAVPLADGTTRVWTLDGAMTMQLGGHSNQVSVARYSADGTRLATAGDDGVVRIWDADTGHAHWRAPMLLQQPPRLLSHRGWIAMDDTPVAPLRSAWSDAVETSARFAEQGTPDDRLCVWMDGDGVALWDTAADRKLVTHPTPELQDLRAADDACVARSPEGVRLLRDDGIHTLVTGPTDAIGVGSGATLVASGNTLFTFDRSGERTGNYPTDVGVTALTRTDDFIILGYRDGTLAALRVSGQSPEPTDFFEDVPAGPVTRIVAGAMNTIVAGYADGTVAMWSVLDGARLANARLHGPVTHLVVRDGVMLAASDLGRFVTWDLGVFHRDYCDVLREVWGTVSVVWERGRAVQRPAPPDHRCRE